MAPSLPVQERPALEHALFHQRQGLPVHEDRVVSDAGRQGPVIRDAFKRVAVPDSVQRANLNVGSAVIGAALVAGEVVDKRDVFTLLRVALEPRHGSHVGAGASPLQADGRGRRDQRRSGRFCSV